MKKCKECLNFLPEIEFNRRGEDRRRAICRWCMRGKQTRAYKPRNKRWKGDPIKTRAQQKVRDAVRYGKIKKPSSCNRCGNTGQICGHHHDYDKPLEVEWLCNICHAREHMQSQPATATN